MSRVFSEFHRTHTRHHDHPTPHNGLPDLWVFGLYFAITIGLWWFGLAYLMTIDVAVMGMLLAYEFVHFSTHTRYKPMTRWGRRIRANHLAHHYADESQGFSMLFPFG